MYMSSYKAPFKSQRGTEPVVIEVILVFV